jgi:Family of unknown function (DUF5691)
MSLDDTGIDKMSLDNSGLNDMSTDNTATAIDAAWETLVTTALLGTVRRPGQSFSDQITGALANALQVIATRATSPEHAVLLSAAAIETVRLTGVQSTMLPASSIETFETPGALIADQTHHEQRTPCSPAAGQILDLLLSGTVAVARQEDDLINDWATKCKQANQRPMPRHLPELLQRATGNQAIRSSVAHAVGDRGRLMAQYNPDWSWLEHELLAINVSPQSEISAEGLAVLDASLRVAQVHAWRGIDPAAARNAVDANWSKESASDRAAFVEAFRVGLSLDDETFLERALDDRTKTVRANAASLLAAMPETAYANRMRERIERIVEVKKGILGTKLRIALPAEESFDKSWARDGIEKTTPQTIGTRAWLLRQLAALSPLTVWEDITGLTPAQILKAAKDMDTYADVYEPWAGAVSRERNVAWARAFVSAGTHSGMAALLPKAEAEDFAIQALREMSVPQHELVNLLMTLAPPVGAPVSRALFAAIERTSGEWLLYHVVGLLPLFESLEPEVFEGIMQRFPEDDPRKRALRHLHSARSLQLAIAKEFS